MIINTQLCIPYYKLSKYLKAVAGHFHKWQQGSVSRLVFLTQKKHHSTGTYYRPTMCNNATMLSKSTMLSWQKYYIFTCFHQPSNYHKRRKSKKKIFTLNFNILGHYEWWTCYSHITFHTKCFFCVELNTLHHLVVLLTVRSLWRKLAIC